MVIEKQSKDYLLSDQQVSKQYGISISLLRKWRYESKGIKWIKVGRLARYRIRDIEAYLEKQTVEVAYD